MYQYFEYSSEIEKAIKDRRPVIALESTLITHGLPYPQNIETALSIEEIVRKHDVAPATIAIMNGKIKIGLSQTELETLVQDAHAVKASKRDIPYVLSQKLNAGTTVAATLFCADYAGIKLFATGGIGGVHRGEEQDISADLIELAKTPIAVICAGAKAILDLPKTLEFLETYSIPVIGYRTKTFPAFYSATTAYKLSAHVEDIDTLANLLRLHWQLSMPSGILIANPIPLEDEIANDIIEPVIAGALKLAETKKINGKDITPFLLSEIAQATEGKSLQANIHLIKNNARLGAIIANALTRGSPC